MLLLLWWIQKCRHSIPSQFELANMDKKYELLLSSLHSLSTEIQDVNKLLETMKVTACERVQLMKVNSSEKFNYKLFGETLEYLETQINVVSALKMKLSYEGTESLQVGECQVIEEKTMISEMSNCTVNSSIDNFSSNRQHLENKTIEGKSFQEGPISQNCNEVPLQQPKLAENQMIGEETQNVDMSNCTVPKDKFSCNFKNRTIEGKSFQEEIISQNSKETSVHFCTKTEEKIPIMDFEIEGFPVGYYPNSKAKNERRLVKVAPFMDHQHCRDVFKFNELLPILISHIVKVNEFFCTLKSRYSDLLTLNELLIETLPEQLIPTEPPRPGQIYCARYADNHWYRAKVLKYEIKTKSCNVLFCDYGNSFDLPITDLRTIDERCLKEPFFAVHCILRNIFPVDTLKDNGAPLLRELCERGELQIKAFKEFAKSSIYHVVVDLYNDEHVNVVPELIQEGCNTNKNQDTFPSIWAWTA